MARHKASWLKEVARFERLVPRGAPRTEEGLAQFHAYESRGERPDIPDPYFARLLDGKAWWEWTLNEYAGLYGTPEWPGWALLEQDFGGDPRGLQQVRDRVSLRVGHQEVRARQRSTGNGYVRQVAS